MYWDTQYTVEEGASCRVLISSSASDTMRTQPTSVIARSDASRATVVSSYCPPAPEGQPLVSVLLLESDKFHPMKWILHTLSAGFGTKDPAMHLNVVMVIIVKCHSQCAYSVCQKSDPFQIVLVHLVILLPRTVKELGYP